MWAAVLRAARGGQGGRVFRPGPDGLGWANVTDALCDCAAHHERPGGEAAGSWRLGDQLRKRLRARLRHLVIVVRPTVSGVRFEC